MCDLVFNTKKRYTDTQLAVLIVTGVLDLTLHQITESLPFSHSGGEPIVGLSSTWCCNPQFRITVRKAADVVVCLGQRDPRVANKKHVRKQQRRNSIGMQVCHVCAFHSQGGRGLSRSQG